MPRFRRRSGCKVITSQTLNESPREMIRARLSGVKKTRFRLPTTHSCTICPVSALQSLTRSECHPQLAVHWPSPLSAARCPFGWALSSCCTVPVAGSRIWLVRPSSETAANVLPSERRPNVAMRCGERRRGGPRRRREPSRGSIRVTGQRSRPSKPLVKLEAGVRS